MKDELKEKIKLAMHEDFVGNFVFTNEEEEIIIEEASMIFRIVCYEKGVTLSYSDYSKIFVALVIITKYWDSQNETFLDNIYKRLLGKQIDRPEAKAYHEIINLIDYLGRAKRIFLLSCFKKKYYATLLSHAFVPIYSMESFFDMCWEIYNYDLEQNYIINDPAINIIARSLKNKLTDNSLQEEDNLQIGSKVYAFRAGIKGLIIDEPQLLMKLLNVVLEAINIKFNAEPLNRKTYLKELINNWWSKKEKTFGIYVSNKRTNHQSIVIDYSQIKAKYILEEGIAKLEIPAFRLSDNLDYSPYLSIYNEGNLIVSERLCTSGSGILMRTKMKSYELKKILNSNSINLNVIIEHCGNRIYDSCGSLYREFILFKDNKEVSTNESVPGLYYLYIRNFDELIKYPKDITIMNNIVNTYSFNAVNGDVLAFKDKVVLFVNENANRDICFVVNVHDDIKYRCGNEEYNVIDGELYVKVSKNINVKEYGIRFNDNIFKLKDFECINTKNSYRFEISSHINIGEKQEISFFKYVDNSVIATMNIIKFNNITVQFNKKIYFNDDEGKVEFSTDKFVLKRSFNVDNDELLLPLNEGDIILYPPIIKWRIDDGKWYSREKSIPTWYKKYHNGSILEVSIPKGLNYIIGLDNTTIDPHSSNKFKIGQYLFAKKEETNSECFNLFLRCNNDYYLFDIIYIKEKFIEVPVIVDSINKLITWHPEYYIGDDDARLNMKIYNQNKITYDENLSNFEEAYEMSNIDDGKYHICIYQNSKNIFKKETIVLFDKQFVIGDERKFKYNNARFKISNVMCSKGAKMSRIRPMYIDNIKYIGETEQGYFYSGKIYLIDKSKNQKRYLDYLYNERGEKLTINPIRIEKRTERTVYIGYGLNENDEELEYDNEFTIDPVGKISIIFKSYDNRYKPIDYYEIEVEKNV